MLFILKFAYLVFHVLILQTYILFLLPSTSLDYTALLWRRHGKNQV